MKLLIIAAFALLLLGGGGAGAYFYFKQPAEASSGAAAEHAEGSKKKSDGHGGVAQSTFVQLSPLILPIIGKNGMTQTVSMVIVIETADPANQAQIEHLAPRLKDAFIQDMYGVLSQEDVAMKDGVIQVNTIKTRLHKISQKVLGEEVAKEVLLQVIQQRPI